jgi:hypothetical protein
MSIHMLQFHIQPGATAMASFATTSGSRNARFTAGHDRSRGTPEEFKRLIVDEIRNWKDTAQRADIKAE